MATVKYSSCFCGLAVGVLATITIVMILNDSGRVLIGWRAPDTLVHGTMHGNRDSIISDESGVVPVHYNATTYNYRDHTKVLVYMHIQKTGGSTFIENIVNAVGDNGRHLCYPLPLSVKKNVRINRDIYLCPYKEVPSNITKLPEMWLVAEKTFGWICGPHPLLSELLSCVPDYYNTHYGLKERHYYYFTILRHPVMRSISEFAHIQRGAKWTYLHTCRGRVIGPDRMPPCYHGYYDKEHWVGVTLDKFLSCETNWAHNRQTIALADLTNAECLDRVDGNREAQDRVLLQSAKANLRNMAYFAITEYMVQSGALLEHSMGLRLDNPLTQKKVDRLHTNDLAHKVWSDKDLYNRIAQANHLDMQLYQYALELFKERLKAFSITINENSLQESIMLHV